MVRNLRCCRHWLVRRICRMPSVMLVMILVCCANSKALGDQISYPLKATTSRAAKEDSIRSIPFGNLSNEAQQRLYAVIKKPTMFRRMPVSVINCDPEMHRFTVRHPEVIVNIWQLMGITSVTAERMAPYVLKCGDGVGTTTSMELVYGNHDTHILLCEGEYDGPLFRKPLTGRCVLVLKSGSVTSERGYKVTNRLDIFLQIDHAGLDIFAKTLHPLLGKSADVNFTESMKFLERMSRASEVNNDGMQHLAGQLTTVQEPIRKEFSKVVSNVHQRYVQLKGEPTVVGHRPRTIRR